MAGSFLKTSLTGSIIIIFSFRIMDELVDDIVQTLLRVQPIRIPLRYQGDEGVEWRGGPIVDYDRVSERWHPPSAI
jgi:hypothetical protein